MVELNIAGINEELKRTHRWVTWQEEDVQDGGKLRKSMKPPKNAKTGEPAKHNDHTTWSDFETARDAHEKNLPLKPSSNCVAVHPVRGIGVVIGPPFFGIDLDDVRDPVTGVIEPEAQAFIKEVNSLTEISPSGTGVHIWAHGEPPYKEGHRKDGREIYSTNRYLTVTGAVIEGYEQIRRFTPAEVKELYDRVKAGKKGLTNPVRNTSASYTAAKIQDMMNKTDFPDLSQAVQSLLTLLAIEYRLDAVKIEEEFKKSKLYSDTHWKDKWDRLGAAEVKKAIEYGRENIDKRLSRKVDAPVTRRRNVQRGNDTKRRHAKYMWEPVLPLGKLTHFGGPSSQGKSPVIADLAARVTRGTGEWPDGQPITQGPKDVIIFNVEDSWEDTILPRFDLAGGDDSRLFYFKGVTVTKGDNSYEAIANFQDDLLEICEEARSHPDLGLIVVDPMTNHLGKAKMNAEEEVRNIINPLAALAEELQCCAITVGHLNKSEGKDPLQRMMGAAAFVGVARSVYMFGRDPDVLDSPYHHIMAPCRGTMGDAFTYHTEVVEREWEEDKSKVIKIVWGQRSKATAEDATSPASKKEQSEISKAARLLRDYLNGGRQTIFDCKQFMKSNGYDLDTMKADRVKEAARVAHKKDGKTWYWFLTTGQDEIPVMRNGKDDPPSY